MKVLLIFVEVILIGLSAICSGLNVAVMSLDTAALRRSAKLGNKQAKRVLPLRRNSHLTLAAILLVNVAVISASSLVLDSWLNGVVAGALSTLLIVLFGEIIPQAFFVRHALVTTALLAPLLKVLILVTYIISKPLQLLLDKLVGKSPHILQSRQELGLIISEHKSKSSSELDEGEVDIIKGALGLSEKRVRDIMTPINKVYWLQPSSVIDGTKIDELKDNAHSRIPIFNRQLTKSYGILLLKDLVDIDFDEKATRIDGLPLHQAEMVGSMTALDTLFKRFINSHTHLLPVERDDKIIGIVTIEDLIEEVIGHEIEDEKDAVK